MREVSWLTATTARMASPSIRTVASAAVHNGQTRARWGCQGTTAGGAKPVAQRRLAATHYIPTESGTSFLASDNNKFRWTYPVFARCPPPVRNQ